MKIGIILHPYGEKYPGGLSRAILELTRALISRDTENEYMVFTKGTPPNPPSFPGKNWAFYPLEEGRLWLEGLRRAPTADVYIFNTPVLPFFFNPKRSIAIALDFAYLHFPPESFRERAQKIVTRFVQGTSLRRATEIVAISEATKKDAIRLFGVPGEKIRVIYPGFNPIDGRTSEPFPVPGKYFLLPGVIKERKNTLGAIEGFRTFLRTHPRYFLVLAGKGEGAYHEKVRAYIKEKKIEGHVLLPGFVSEAELSFLYRHAEALLFPSMVEGFGFPVLEAMACGLPVITSRGSSLPELAGDAALLVNPESVEEIAKALGHIADDPKLGANLAAKGRAQAKKFSWEKAAGDWLALLKQAF